MPKKSASPNKFVETQATTPQARLLYMGAYEMAKRKEELSNPKPRKASNSKSSYKRWLFELITILTFSKSILTHDLILSFHPYLLSFHELDTFSSKLICLDNLENSFELFLQDSVNDEFYWYSFEGYEYFVS